MSRTSASDASFTVTCPGCSQKLRFLVSPDMPARIRVQCFACKTAFGVRRPGADPGEATLPGTSSPTLVGMPVLTTTGQVSGSTAPPVSVQPQTSEPTSPIARSVAPGRRDAVPSFAPGALMAGLALLCRDRFRAMSLELAGGLTFIGVVLSVLIEPDQMIRLFTLSDQPE